MYVFQGLVFLALIGNIAAFLSHKKAIPFVIGVVSPALIFFAFYIRFNSALIYSGLFGLLVAAVWNYIESRKCKTCV